MKKMKVTTEKYCKDCKYYMPVIRIFSEGENIGRCNLDDSIQIALHGCPHLEEESWPETLKINQRDKK